MVSFHELDRPVAVILMTLKKLLRLVRLIWLKPKLNKRIINRNVQENGSGDLVGNVAIKGETRE